MVIKRKKNSRQRGSRTHGWGKGKAHHKGSGNKGGKGKAGTGKRADQKKPSVWASGYFGKGGFTPRKKENIIPININDLDLRLDRWVNEGKAAKKDEAYEVDLSKVGYNKLLSAGSTAKKINVNVKFYSKAVEEKIKKAGGSLPKLSKIKEDSS